MVFQCYRQSSESHVDIVHGVRAFDKDGRC